MNKTINMNHTLKAVALLFISSVALIAHAEEAKPMHANNDVSNKASLQRGARNFINYCSGCHSLKFVRYNRLSVDLDLTDAQVQDNLDFTKVKLTDMMTINMDPADGKSWFGKTPPDLSLIARSRGVDYLYTFLHSFYLDPSRPTGMNNVVLPAAAMPNVLWELQGLQKATYKGVTADNGNVEKVFTGLEAETDGKLKPEEYDQFVRDLVNFLDYVGEPGQVERRSLGIRVVGFLLVLFLLAYALKKEYWKDVK
jgi:ubiquinol-cytochrome c reductase cytochrome c1 subunit